MKLETFHFSLSFCFLTCKMFLTSQMMENKSNNWMLLISYVDLTCRFLRNTLSSVCRVHEDFNFDAGMCIFVMFYSLLEIPLTESSVQDRLLYSVTSITTMKATDNHVSSWYPIPAHSFHTYYQKRTFEMDTCVCGSRLLNTSIYSVTYVKYTQSVIMELVSLINTIEFFWCFASANCLTCLEC